MNHFLHVLSEKWLLLIINRHLSMLNGHKAYVALEVLTKSKAHRIDMITLPTYTSHGLQPLDVHA